MVNEVRHETIKFGGSGGQGSRIREAEVRFGSLAEASFSARWVDYRCSSLSTFLACLPDPRYCFARCHVVRLSVCPDYTTTCLDCVTPIANRFELLDDIRGSDSYAVPRTADFLTYIFSSF